MQAPAFLPASPLKLRFASTPARLTPNRTPTCELGGLGRHLAAAAAAAAVTLSLSALPPANPTQAVPYAYQPPQSLSVTTAHTHSHSSTPLVVGVGKAAIHDYTPYGEHEPVTHTMARSVEQHPLDEEARREFSLAVRLVTAVLLGVMLGVERRATSLNLGVRSITLVSLCAAMASLMATGGEAGLTVPLITMAPHVAVVSAAAVAGLTVYAAARLRQRKTRHMAAMSWTIALGVAMGGACGAGLSLLSVSSYLAAVAVMRSGGSGGRPVDRAQRVVDSAAVSSDEDLRVRKSVGRMPLDPLINLGQSEGIDGPGFSV